MRSSEQSVWMENLVHQMEEYGPEAAAAIEYIRQHEIQLGVHDQPTGARWTMSRRIELHPRFLVAVAGDPLAASLVIHEVRHLQQGPLTALSVYGEMDAWQLQFRFLMEILGRYSADHARAAIIEEIVHQPLSWDRGGLQHARELMKSYAGPTYRIDLLPLYPIHREFVFRLSGRHP